MPKRRPVSTDEILIEPEIRLRGSTTLARVRPV